MNAQTPTRPGTSAQGTDAYTARLHRAQAAMHAHGLDYLFVGPSADLLYLTGLDRSISERLLLLIVPQDGPAHLVLPAFEAGGIGTLPEMVHLAPWEEHEDPVARAAQLLETPGGGGEGCTVAVGDRLAAGFLLRLQAALPRAAFTHADTILPPLRLIKDAAEIALLREAGARADAAFAEFRRLPFVGRSERAMAIQIAEILRRHELVVEWGPIVGSGPNGAAPHHSAGDRVIEEGDLIVLDFGGRYRGYNADMTRTVTAGRLPEDEARAVHEHVRVAQEAAVRAARPGLAAAALDRVARDHLATTGYGAYFTHRLGHGLGLDAHEHPYIVTGNEQTLQPGMVFSVEPGLYLPGRFGVRIEDIVVLTETGAERLNHSPRELLLVE
jgi:D-alanyl-D-alanine dipeptidase